MSAELNISSRIEHEAAAARAYLLHSVCCRIGTTASLPTYWLVHVTAQPYGVAQSMWDWHARVNPYLLA